MIYRSLLTGEKLSRLAFGIMRLPVIKTENGAEDIDTQAATEMIDRAIAGGVNYFDTAWPYHEGQSEPFLGTALVDRYPRGSFYLATKLPVWETDSPEQAQAVFEKQLIKLRTDYIDFYLMHALDGKSFDQIVQNGVLQWAIDLQKTGRIKRLGFSFHGTVDEMRRIIDAHSWDFGMLQLNYLDWELQKAGETYQMLADAGIPVFVMEPVRGGKLAKLTDAAEEIMKAAQPNRSIASWAFRYVASLPNVFTILSGMSTLEQLEDNLDTFSSEGEADLALTGADRETLAAALAASNLSAVVPCTACKYCMPCPYEVDIAGVFGSYNAYKMGGSAFGYKMGLKALEDGTLADSCIDCGECVPLCPQDIDIPAEMEKVAIETAKLLTIDEYRDERAEMMVKRGTD